MVSSLFARKKLEAQRHKKRKIVATDCYQSAEAPHSVALASNKYSVKAGSDEVIRIEIDITDKKRNSLSLCLQ